MICIFPNEESAKRLIKAVLMEIDEVWTSGQRNFDVAHHWKWRNSPIDKQGVPTFNQAA